MAYVAMGRSEELKDIYIKGKVDPKGIHASPEALAETKRLQEIFDKRTECLEEQKKNFWKVSYQNVRSLKCHQDDVVIDNYINSADIFALGETWLTENESIPLLGFKDHNANFGRGKGVSMYSKMDEINRLVVNSVKSEIFSAIHYRTVNFDAIFVYWSSGCTREETNEILSLLKSWIIKERPTVIMGDMNLDFSEESKVNKFFQGEGLCQLITKSTCETGSLLDHIYTNEQLKKLGITTQQCCSYWTDHDTISIFIPK